MPHDTIVIYGAGDHGQVVLDTCEVLGLKAMLYDDQGTNGAKLAKRLPKDGKGQPLIVAIGDNRVRQEIGEEMMRRGYELTSVVHPSATVAKTAKVGRGVFIGAHAHLGPRASVGDGVIVNNHANVDHHVTVGNWSHIAVSASICGQVRITEGVLVGANASVGPGATVMPWAKIGSQAGVRMREFVPDGETWVGVPAKKVVKNGSLCGT